jgi:hypothetical protein
MIVITVTSVIGSVIVPIAKDEMGKPFMFRRMHGGDGLEAVPVPRC